VRMDLDDVFSRSLQVLRLFDKMPEAALALPISPINFAYHKISRHLRIRMSR
jgi:hypothetical protein